MKLVAFNKHEDGYAAVWKGKTEKAPAAAVGEECPICCLSLLFGTWLQRKDTGTEEGLQQAQCQNGEGPKIRELPLTVIAVALEELLWEGENGANFPLSQYSLAP